MCHSVRNFMDLFKALCGVICEASFYRPAVCGGLHPCKNMPSKSQGKMACAIPRLPSIWFCPELNPSRHNSVLFICSIPCSLPGLASILLPFSSSLSLSVFLSLPLSISVSIKNDYFFYLKIPTGNTCNGCKDNKKSPPWVENFNSGGEEEECHISMRERKKDWKGITEFKKKERLVCMVEERGYFIKGCWSNNLLTRFFFNEVIAPVIAKKRLSHLDNIASFCLNNLLYFFTLPGVQIKKKVVGLLTRWIRPCGAPCPLSWGKYWKLSHS